MVLSFTAVKISSTRRLYLQFYMSTFYVVSCQDSGSLCIPTTYSLYVCMYNIGKASVNLGSAQEIIQ
jgi:hypothetical protein